MTAPADKSPKRYGYEVLERIPHDTSAYTQGLLILDGKMYESTGRRGESSVRILKLATGEIVKKREIPSSLFGEGLAAVGGLLYQLTWTSHTALVFDRATLRPLGYDYKYEGEGWGLTTCDEGLVMSDGTNLIRFFDKKMNELRRIEVRDQGRPLFELNELEWIDGEIWANVWKQDRVARIDPATGEVRGWIDFSGLLGNDAVGNQSEDVLNGIAVDPDNGDLYVTGKRWPYIFKVRVFEK